MPEDPLSEVRFRWVKQMQALGYGSEIAQRLAFLEAQDTILMLTKECPRNAIFDALRRHQTTVAILDPLVSLHDKEENPNSDMREVLDLLVPYQTETGCTFIIAHHEPKNVESNSAAPRGASAIRDWCRTMLRLSSLSVGDNGAQRFKLDLDKANYGGTVWNLMLERQQDSYLFTPIDLEASITPMQIWELLGQEGNWMDAVIKTICERFGGSKSTARRALQKAEEGNYIVIKPEPNSKTGRQKKYVTRGRGNEG